jgi:mRNA interferase HicA
MLVVFSRVIERISALPPAVRSRQSHRRLTQHRVAAGSRCPRDGHALGRNNRSVQLTQQLCLNGRTQVTPKQFLTSLGATFAPGKGGHLKVFLNGRRSVVPMGSGELKKGTLEAIPRQLGIKDRP